MRIASLIIIFTNAISFMIMQVIFFWFVASENVGEIIRNKITLYNSLTYKIPALKIKFDQKIYENGIIEKEMRRIHNINLMYKWMIFPFSMIIFLLSLCVIIEIIFKYLKKNVDERFDKYDLIILFSVFGAFLTEIIFYFVVIANSRIVSDVKIFEIIFNYYLN